MVDTGRVLIDGKGVGDVGRAVLRERRALSEEGVVAVTIAAGVIENLEYGAVNIFGWSLQGATGIFLALLGLLGEFDEDMRVVPPWH